MSTRKLTFTFPTLIALLISISFCNNAFSQTNISCTSIEAEQIMLGNYNPGDYAASAVVDDHEEIICRLNDKVTPDSLKEYLEILATFHNRNTYADTVSNTTGVGAARRWVYQKFQEISDDNENRLIPAYLQFDWLNGLCGDGLGFRNILAVLPGTDTTDKSIIIIEAHMDSRCDDPCDITCLAEGMEDNGSGTALVIELARVMSQFSFEQTIVFMATVGEEQGLYGGHAMAQYCEDNNIPIKGVQNNDVIGGVICGKTSSPPSCPGVGDVDSTHVRLFSQGSPTFPYRSFARTIKMYYVEKLAANVAVPMTINIMDQEDRTGRGGDHIPFRQRGFTNVRFTSANEHGHGGATQTGYDDRQHTSTDVLGVDTDNDNEIDSFYVDFNYLKRNAVINGMTATLLAQGPVTPDFTLHDEPTGLRVEITSQLNLSEYRVGVRIAPNTEFDEVYRFTGTSFLIPNQTQGQQYFVSVAGIDDNTIMSPFSGEQWAQSDVDVAPGITDNLPYNLNCTALSIDEELQTFIPTEKFELLNCQPNPFQGKTQIAVNVNRKVRYKNALVLISDMQGRQVARLPIELNQGTNAVQYLHELPSSAILYYSLIVDGKTYQTRKMVAIK